MAHSLFLIYSEMIGNLYMVFTLYFLNSHHESLIIKLIGVIGGTVLSLTVIFI